MNDEIKKLPTHLIEKLLSKVQRTLYSCTNNAQAMGTGAQMISEMLLSYLKKHDR